MSVRRAHVRGGSEDAVLSFYVYFLAGFLAGIPGGMGMGGGTLLIPALTVFLAVPQQSAQGLNLLSFLLLALFVLPKHKKNGLLKTEGLWRLILPALLFSALGSFCATAMDGELLRKLFGAFLVALSLIQFTKEKKSDKIGA